jgi:hypothetical protein
MGTKTDPLVHCHHALESAMLNSAVLVLLLALADPPNSSSPVAALSGLPRHSSPVLSERSLAAWRGVLMATEGRRAIEASFLPGHPPDTVFGYFTVEENARLITRRRWLGRRTTGSLVFELKDGGGLMLHPMRDSLVGELTDPTGQLIGWKTALIELTPLRRGSQSRLRQAEETGERRRQTGP